MLKKLSKNCVIKRVCSFRALVDDIQFSPIIHLTQAKANGEGALASIIAKRRNTSGNEGSLGALVTMLPEKIWY
jgi:hypothetical protein